MRLTTRPLRHTLRQALLAAALLAPATGCKSFLGRNAPPLPGARVTFVNQSGETTDVFAMATSGEMFRIGAVGAGRTERLTVPRSALNAGATVNIVARRLATARGISSGPITVRPGDEFTVTLPPSGNTLAVLPGQ